MPTSGEVVAAYYLPEQRLICVYSNTGGRLLFDNMESDNEIRRIVPVWWCVGERGRRAIEQALETRRSLCLS